MKFKKLKKGFTLVELVVVIAVIAILGAVSVGAYFGIVGQANRSADEQGVAQMNSILKADEILNGKPDNVTEVVTILKENGYNANFTTYYSAYDIGWKKAENVVVLIEGANIVYPEEHKENNFDTTAVLPLHEFVSNEEEFLDLIDKAIDGDTITLSGTCNFTSDLVIEKDITISGFGNSIISTGENSIKISKNSNGSSPNVTLNNVNFVASTASDLRTSFIYAPSYDGELIIQNSTFVDTQWDSIQITPINGANIVIRNNKFDTTDSSVHYHKGELGHTGEVKGSHRYVHIETSGKDDCTEVNLTMTMNTFNNPSYCDDSAITIYGPLASNMSLSGNFLTGMGKDNLSTDEVIYGEKTAIWISDGKTFNLLDPKVIL